MINSLKNAVSHKHSRQPLNLAVTGDGEKLLEKKRRTELHDSVKKGRYSVKLN